MANPEYKFKIDAPATVNKVKGLEVVPDSSKGRSFRIEHGAISIPSLDALATGDTVQFQISIQDQNENAALYEINDENEVYTHALKATFTQLDEGLVPDPQKKIILPDISGIHLISGQKYYFNQLITGQDGALPMYVKLRGSYVNKPFGDDLADFHNKSFGG
jgi:hypothetical protein